MEILNRHRQSHPHRRLVSMQTARPLGHAVATDFRVDPHGAMILKVQAELDQDSRMQMVGNVGRKERNLLQTVCIVALKMVLAVVSATDGTMRSEDSVVADLVPLVDAFRVQMDSEDEVEDRCDMGHVPDCKLGVESSGAKVLLPHSSAHADLPPLTQAEVVAIPRRRNSPKVRDRGAGGGSHHFQRC